MDDVLWIKMELFQVKVKRSPHHPQKKEFKKMFRTKLLVKKLNLAKLKCRAKLHYYGVYTDLNTKKKFKLFKHS